MDKKKSLLNVGVSIAFKIVLTVVAILARRFLIAYVGNEANGLNSLYTSLVGVLAIAELGVGSAITFCMYKPIVDGENEKVSALYRLFTKVYLIIGGVILVVGAGIAPFLRVLAKDYSALDTNLYLTFALMLSSVVVSYFFSSKTSLINAYKNNYITTIITSVGQLLQFVSQIVVVVLTRSFEWYLFCLIVGVVFQWIITEIVAAKKYGDVINRKAKVDEETKREVVKNVKAMFAHKVGNVLVNTADSIIISAFIGVVLLGKYSNYTAVMTAMISIISLFFTPLTSVVGQAYASNKEELKGHYKFFYTFNFLLGCVFFLGYYAVIDNLVELLFGNDLQLSKAISMVITVNYFIQFIRQATLLFRDATGTFYNDRWKPLFEGVLNVALSIAFVLLFARWFGEDFAIVGVIVATIITNLTICHVVEPYVLHKHAFSASVKGHLLKNYGCIAAFVAVLFLMNTVMISNQNEWIEMFVNGSVSLVFSAGIIAVTCAVDKNFRGYCKRLLRRKK